MKILANDGISEAGKIALEQAGYQVITDKVAQETLADYLNQHGIEILLVRSATTARKELIDSCPSLQLIGRGGVGMDNIDVRYAQEKGITVINTPASSSQSVAELVMGQMFSISRFLHDSYRNLGSGDFNNLKKAYGKGVELRGKTLGIVGFGRIGQALAGYALGAGMRVVAVGKEATQIEVEVPVGLNQLVKVPVACSTDLNEVLPELDYLSLHVPKQADGGAVLGEEEFKTMKKGVRIVNAARGGVVHEEALLQALDEGQVAFAALDVFNNEPNPDSRLLNHPKIACTPHIGAATNEAQDRIGEELASLIIAQFGNFQVA
jgi:D-3-phosphoglycerate dehydrogenase